MQNSFRAFSRNRRASVASVELAAPVCLRSKPRRMGLFRALGSSLRGSDVELFGPPALGSTSVMKSSVPNTRFGLLAVATAVLQPRVSFVDSDLARP